MFKYDLEATLTVPSGGVVDSIAVTVELTPPDAGCLIYGTTLDGTMTSVEVRGAKSDIDLPFSEPKVYVKYLKGLKNIRISTRGYRIRR